MKAIIVCVSVSHGNTRRIAETMGKALDAPVVTPEQVDVAGLADYDLVGFGSGIFQMDFHPSLRRFIGSLPAAQRSRAFVFSTSGLPELRFRPYTRDLTRLIEQKGFEAAGAFACRGFDTWLPFRLVGGIRRGRPGPTDTEAARTFAEALRARTEAGR